ncbi:MAG: ComEC/Rec2 family competence protein [Planctomycetaceae bacterium]|jgi:competence protein ComEC|nr:ComEC/Rec2 family competence protein [Planctomycetaceae bacterium]
MSSVGDFFRTTYYQPLAVCLVSVIICITADLCFGISVWIWFSFFVGGVVFALLFRQHGLFATVAILIAVGSLFGMRHHLYFYSFQSNDIGFYATDEPSPCAVEGCVVEMPRYFPAPVPSFTGSFPRKDSTHLLVRAERLRDKSDWLPVSGLVIVSVVGDCSQRRIGERVRMFGRLSKPHEQGNPGEMDMRTYRRRYRQLAVLQVTYPDAIQLIETGKPSVRRFIETIRRHAQATFRQTMRPETASVATAMILGIRDEIDEDTYGQLMETGVVHILAISGLHIGLVAGAAGFFLIRLGVQRRWLAIGLASSVLIYLLLSDGRPPVVRATVLVLTASLALFLNRRVVSANSLAFTAIIALLINPCELFQFGAQLSFLGTGVFLWIPTVQLTADGNAKSRGSYFWLWRKTVNGLARVLLFNLLIWLTLMPLLMDRMHLFTPVVILLNPLLWLPMTVAILSGFFMMFAGAVDIVTALVFLPPLAPVFGAIADASFGTLLTMADLAHRIPYGHFWVAGQPLWWMFAFYVPLIFWTLVPQLRLPRRWFVAFLTLLVIAAFGYNFACGVVRKRDERMTVEITSVGHGLGILIIAPDSTATIYDAGSLTMPERATDVLSRRLWAYGKRRIDRLILSHPDSDHYNASFNLLERFSVGEVFVPPGMFEKNVEGVAVLKQAIEAKKIPIRTVHRGDKINGTPAIRVFHPTQPNDDGSPPYEPDTESNALSLLIMFEHKDVRIMLTGDIDVKQATHIFSEPSPKVSVMLVPHHGGQSSVTTSLFRWASPEHLLISGGRMWRKPELINDLTKSGYKVHSTYEHGLISITIDKEKFEIEHFKR